jgi:hypothetical protein
VCQEEVWVVKFFSHRKRCRQEQKDKEFARMRKLAIERLQETWVRPDRKSKGNAA